MLKTLIKNADYSWEFGDSSASTRQAGISLFQQSRQPYMITLTSGKCTWRKEVLVIMNTPAAANSQPDIFLLLMAPLKHLPAGRSPSPTLHQPPKAGPRRLLRDNAEPHGGSSVTYTFSSPCERTLSLIINGDSSHMGAKTYHRIPARAPEHQSS